jgi:DNA transformation protein
VARESFTGFVLDQLRALGEPEARSMFGGKGLYWRDAIFGLIDEGRLYFRVSPLTAGRYEAAGSRPFEPWPGHVMKGYWEVPAGVLEDPEELSAWAREAWSQPRSKASIGKRARASAKTAKNKKGRSRTR